MPTFSWRTFPFFGLLCSIILTGAGCFGGSGSGSKVTGPDGGVYKTANGNEWRQLTRWNQGTKFGSIANVGTSVAAVDPQDARAMYLGTVENGLLFSLDGGESWKLAEGVSVGKVYAIAVDPKDKCTVYVALSSRVMKTSNCLRDWNEIYKESRADVRFTALALDWHDANRVYLTTTDGDVFQSVNAGESWKPVHRVDGVKLTSIAIDLRDSRSVYIGTYGSGIVKTVDAGASWQNIYKPLQEFDGATRVTHLVMDPHAAQTLYQVSRHGVLQSVDGGATWKAMTLPSPAGSVEIKAFVVHPKEAKRLVYATDTAIVFSKDGGQTWTSKKLPTTRRVSFLSFDGAEQSALYLGVMPPKQ